MFDPGLGRFLSMDPRSSDGADLLFEHPFVYVKNNPVNRSDPSGLGSNSAEVCEKYKGCCRMGDLKACALDIICMSSMTGPDTWKDCVRPCLAETYRCFETGAETAKNHAYCWSKCALGALPSIPFPSPIGPPELPSIPLPSWPRIPRPTLPRLPRLTSCIPDVRLRF
jgi:hypothetical protein